MVELRDGRHGIVVDVINGGEAFVVELANAKGWDDLPIVRKEDIMGVPGALAMRHRAKG